jgi:hypothetical protein
MREGVVAHEGAISATYTNPIRGSNSIAGLRKTVKQIIIFRNTDKGQNLHFGNPVPPPRIFRLFIRSDNGHPEYQRLELRGVFSEET